MLEPQEQSESQDLGTLSSQDGASKDLAPESQGQNQVAETIHELEKLGKFKYQGQEWTAKDLERAMLRQQDYTRKTQALSKDRETFDSERKFYENLHADLNNLKNNPQLLNEFIRVYPEKFHQYAKQLFGSPTQSNTQQSSQPYQDVETLSRLNKLEGYFHEQEVAKNTQQINSTIDSLSKKYPDALQELAISRVYEAHNRGEQISEATWEQSFRDVDAMMKNLVKERYGSMVKKQSEANKKAADVPSGGGTLGRAPQKFKSLGDVTKHAINDLTSKG